MAYSPWDEFQEKIYQEVEASMSEEMKLDQKVDMSEMHSYVPRELGEWSDYLYKRICYPKVPKISWHHPLNLLDLQFFFNDWNDAIKKVDKPNFDIAEKHVRDYYNRLVTIKEVREERIWEMVTNLVYVAIGALITFVLTYLLKL